LDKIDNILVKQELLMLPDIDNDILLILSDIFDSLGSALLEELATSSIKLLEAKGFCFVLSK